jgi:Protein of unknown function (DUF3014)
MKRAFLWMIPIFAVAGLAALYFWPTREALQSPPVAAPAAEPAIRYPIEPIGPQAESLPALVESDGAVGNALAELLGPRLEKFLNLQDIVRRIVATVDELPRQNVSLRLMPVKPVTGQPITAGTGEGLSLSSQNAARYRPYVELAEAVPTAKVVAVYTRFYPLFQEQYENLGHPDRYFNDRVVDVIDHLLAAPEVEEPVRLVQRKVLYEFADPKLEALSVGQKILVRMGADNMVKVKAKLREIRDALVSKPPYSE